MEPQLATPASLDGARRGWPALLLSSPGRAKVAAKVAAKIAANVAAKVAAKVADSAAFHTTDRLRGRGARPAQPAQRAVLLAPQRTALALWGWLSGPWLCCAVEASR